MCLRLLLLLLLTSTAVSAQKVTLSGKVLDRDSNEPLPLASIYIKGQTIGTVANLNGEFDFHFPATLRMEIIVVSMLGYENYEAPAWSLLDDNNPKTILLSKSITLLGEIVVTTDSLSGGEIFRIAMSRISQNYPDQPFLLDGFYRDIKKVSGTYIALLEAAVKIYDENYSEPRNKSKLRERVKLIEVRKSLGYESKFTTFFSDHNLLEDLLLHNNVRYRQIDVEDEFFKGITREDDSYYNGHPIYVVTKKEDIDLKVFIDKEDFSIIHLAYEQVDVGDNLAHKKNLVSKLIGVRKAIDFRKYNGKMYLNYITVTSRENWYDAETNTLKFETELIQDLLINEIHPNTTETISATEKMRNYGLQYQDYPYNKAFWDNYNVIKETPLDIQIRIDLERHGALEAQFQDN
jgi:hypothetical protein